MYDAELGRRREIVVVTKADLPASRDVCSSDLAELWPRRAVDLRPSPAKG